MTWVLILQTPVSVRSVLEQDRKCDLLLDSILKYSARYLPSVSCGDLSLCKFVESEQVGGGLRLLFPLLESAPVGEPVLL